MIFPASHVSELCGVDVLCGGLDGSGWMDRRNEADAKVKTVGRVLSSQIWGEGNQTQWILVGFGKKGAG